ncbi:MAG: 16S rRNA (guanine(527)-N(7))-methyltransferase RsmG [Marmoricola sp.]
MFAAALPLAEQFAQLLASEATVRGLIGPREVPRLWERHLLNCAVVTELMAADATVCDVGSGAGLPGIALAIRRPDLRVTLLEPLLRRTAFLELAVAELGLQNVVVRRGRAEETKELQFDVVTSRAVAPMDRLARWSLPLTRGGGLFLAMKGSTAMAEVDQHRSLIHRLGGREISVESVGERWLRDPVTVVRTVKAS